MSDTLDRYFNNWLQSISGFNLYDTTVELEPKLFPFSFSATPHDTGKWNLLRISSSSNQVGEVPQGIASNPSGNRTRIKLHVLDRFLFVKSFPRFYKEAIILTNSSFGCHLINHGKGLEYNLTFNSQEESRIYQLLESMLHGTRIQKEVILETTDSGVVGLLDFGLSRPAFIPFDPNSTLNESLTAFIDKELDTKIEFQINSIKASQPWSQYLTKIMVLASGSNSQLIPKHLSIKTESPLVFTRVQLKVIGTTHSQVQENCNVITRLVFNGTPNHNSFKALSNINLPLEIHKRTFDTQTSTRTGCLLNLTEVVNIVSPPGSDISLKGLDKKNHGYPVNDRRIQGQLKIGFNNVGGQSKPVYLNRNERLRHTHIIGGTGTGKSTLLKNMIRNDLKTGLGCTVFDPHGDLINDLMNVIPESRIKDVILLDPTDFDYPIGFNLLEATSEAEKIVLSSDLVEVFKSQATSWGDQMTTILHYAINVFLERKESGSLLELKLFLENQKFRNQILSEINDEHLQHFWNSEFPRLRKNSVSPILTRLEVYLMSKTLRRISSIKNGISFKSVFEEQKIVLVNLAQGIIGFENSRLLGSMIQTKLVQAAFGRSADRTPHFVYIDEFHLLSGKSLPNLLSGVRKFGVGITLAHQNLGQLHGQDDLKSALLSNTHTRFVFKVGIQDARQFESDMGLVEVDNLIDQEVGECIIRFGSPNDICSLSIPYLEENQDSTKVEQIRDSSRAQICVSADQADQQISLLYSQTRNQHRKNEPEEIVQQTFHSDPIKDSTSPSEKPLQFDLKETKGHIERTKAQEKKKGQIREHRAIQNRLKQIGVGYGYKATLEYKYGDKYIDLVLENKEIKIAIEVSVGNHLDYEVENIKKCLNGKFDKVIFISESQRKREGILKNFPQTRNLLIGRESIVAQVLHDKAIESTTEVVHGYIVKVNYTEEVSDSIQESLKATLKTKKKNKPED